eukprot:SAG25_NODE_142_length_14075_cov_38.666070_14_plen_120_part_00
MMDQFAADLHAKNPCPGKPHQGGAIRSRGSALAPCARGGAMAHRRRGLQLQGPCATTASVAAGRHRRRCAAAAQQLSGAVRSHGPSMIQRKEGEKLESCSIVVWNESECLLRNETGVSL